VLILKRIFPLYKPDVVVIVFLPNDLFTNTPISEEYELKGDSAVHKRGEKDSNSHLLTLYKRALISFDWIYAKLYLMTGRGAYFSSPSTQTFEDKMNLTKELLERAARYSESRGAEFLVISIPQQFQVLYKENGYKFDNTDVDLIDEEFQKFAEEKGFTWITLLDVLAEYKRNEGTELYYRLDGHLNKDGNNVVGDYITSAFIERFGGIMNLSGR